MITSALLGLTATAGIVALASPAQAVGYADPCDAGQDLKEDTCIVNYPDHMVKVLDTEKLDSYFCPDTHKYLLNVDYGSGINGVGVRGTGPGRIDVNYRGLVPSIIRGSDGKAIGSGQGTVTNWGLDPHPYGIQLHCTSNPNKGY